MAATSGAIKAGRAYVEIFADSSPLIRGLKAASGKLKAWGSSLSSIGAGMAGIGAAVLTPLLAAANTFNAAGSALNDLSVQTGLSAETLGAFGHAAKLSGVELDDVATSMNKLQKLVGEAKTGSQGAADTLARLGLSAEKLVSMKPEEQYLAMSDALNSIGDAGKRAYMFTEIFGKSGAKIQGFSKDLRKLSQEARDLGIVMSAEDVEAADTLGDAMDTLGSMFKTIWVQVGAALAPVLIDLAGMLRDVLVPVITWIKENRGLVVTLAGVAVGLVAAGAATYVLGTALAVMAPILGAAATALTALFSQTGIAVAGAVVAYALLAAALAVGAYAWLNYTDSGKEALAFLGEEFGILQSNVMVAVQGIIDALSTGDITAAANILWAGLKVIWADAILALNKAWQKWGREFFNTAAGAYTDLLHLTNTFEANMKTAFTNLTAEWDATWVGWTSSFSDHFTTSALIVVKNLEFIANALKKITGVGIGVDFAKLKEGIAKGYDPKTAEKIKAIEDKQGADLKKNEQDFRAARQGIDDAAVEDFQKRQELFDKALQIAKDEAEKARGELKGLAGGAAEKRARGRGPVGQPSGMPVPNFDPFSAGRTSATGTFGTNIEGLGAGNTVVGKLQEQIELLKIQNQLVKNQKLGGLIAQ